MDKLRAACLGKGLAGIRGLGRTFRILDVHKNGRLTLEEFRQGLRNFELLGSSISEDDAQQLFLSMDRDDNNTVSCNEFLRALRPPMAQCRLDLVDLVFDILDEEESGVITVEDLMLRYDVTKFPKFQSGELTRRQVLKQFLDQFQPEDMFKDDQVTKEEFVEYYAGVSASTDQDIHFDLMMRQTWKL